MLAAGVLAAAALAADTQATRPAAAAAVRPLHLTSDSGQQEKFRVAAAKLAAADGLSDDEDPIVCAKLANPTGCGRW